MIRYLMYQIKAGGNRVNTAKNKMKNQLTLTEIKIGSTIATIKSFVKSNQHHSSFSKIGGGDDSIIYSVKNEHGFFNVGMDGKNDTEKKRELVKKAIGKYIKMNEND